MINLMPNPGLSAKLRAPDKGPGKVIGISADGLNCTCEFLYVNGQQKQVVHHVSHLKRYEMWHLLRLTIRWTPDGHMVRPSIQQVIAEVVSKSPKESWDTALGMDSVLHKIKELQEKKR